MFNILRGKKGISDQMLLVVIIAIVVFVVLLFLSNAITGILKKKGDEESFRTAAITAAKTPKGFVELPKERRQVVLLEDGYKIDGKAFDVPAMNKEAMSKIIAEEMRSCWYKFLEGKQNVFSFVQTGRGLTTPNKAICYICSMISVDAAAKKSDLALIIPNFDGYLREHKPFGVASSYYDYFDVHPFVLSSDNHKLRHELLPEADKGLLDLIEPYTVILLSTRAWEEGLHIVEYPNEEFLMLRQVSALDDTLCEDFYN